MDHLTLQVGVVHAVIVDHADRAHARSGQIKKDGRSKPACTDHQNPRLFQAALACAAQCAQHDMAGITIKFSCGERTRGHSSLWVSTRIIGTRPQA